MEKLLPIIAGAGVIAYFLTKKKDAASVITMPVKTIPSYIPPSKEVFMEQAKKQIQRLPIFKNDMLDEKTAEEIAAYLHEGAKDAKGSVIAPMFEVKVVDTSTTPSIEPVPNEVRYM